MISPKLALSIYKAKGKILSILGYTIELFLLIGFIGFITSIQLDSLLFTVIMMAICSLLIINGRKIKHSVKRIYKYLSLISINKITSIDLIALKTNQSIDIVRDDIQKMIDKGFIEKSYIDDNNEIIIVNLDKNSTSTAQNIAKDTTITISCSSCGAINKLVSGISSFCEYCGSPINKI